MVLTDYYTRHKGGYRRKGRDYSTPYHVLPSSDADMVDAPRFSDQELPVSSSSSSSSRTPNEIVISGGGGEWYNNYAPQRSWRSVAAERTYGFLNNNLPFAARKALARLAGFKVDEVQAAHDAHQSGPVTVSSVVEPILLEPQEYHDASVLHKRRRGSAHDLDLLYHQIKGRRNNLQIQHLGKSLQHFPPDQSGTKLSRGSRRLNPPSTIEYSPSSMVLHDRFKRRSSVPTRTARRQETLSYRDDL